MNRRFSVGHIAMTPFNMAREESRITKLMKRSNVKGIA
jgi:hypothetical protein